MSVAGRLAAVAILQTTTQDVFIFANSLIDIRSTQVDWDSLKCLNALGIPQISTRPFQFVQHMGVIVVPSGVCSDETRTLIDKLAEGTIYNHKGTYSVLAISGPGRKIPKPELKIVRALEFIGKTRMCLSQELLRVDRSTDALPRYSAIFWNCHDYAVNLAIIIVENFPPPSALMKLSSMVEDSKSPFCRKLEEFVVTLMLIILCVGALFCVFDLLGYTSARIVILFALLSATFWDACYIIFRFQQVEALQLREAWIHILEQRFSRLFAFRRGSFVKPSTIGEPLWFPRG
ncbi:hypothetical protein BDV32DRAFT_146822 [Aspergillus pseudonomiae]|uniref:Uncharacterized protein n=1 Tax=Aspergillus pseudonomiae TaxID=1506151 RepID=A0A5N6I8M3_9EURO|nr:uncharacterized protein BDV37DRAFT_278729 [Aspergillus pseudonomiae]KAB8263031.1 hypothetical protein BDV32DRAFT_146822 [Aspergillus pseudonomiae]KAE8408722.1 hypothetical protein BDV37DRAFT_278729 [Aspergillus pseudonomiae]